MRQCPQCRRTFDNTWKQCLYCKCALIESTDAAPIEQAVAELEKRVARLEASAGIRYEAPAPKQAPAATPVPPADRPAARAKSAAGPDLEQKIGLVWLNRIGVLALLFGAAFFLKYAFDNRWIGPMGQVMIGFACGIGFIAAGEWARRKPYDVTAQGLLGVGAGILYLSSYASFAFYHLVPSFAALATMAAVTVFCGVWAVRTNWPSLAVIGMLGGFLTPILIGDAFVSPALLMTYIVVLDLGVLAVSSIKKWDALNFGTLVFTWVLYPGWKHGVPWTQAAAGATAFFAVYSLVAILYGARRRERTESFDVAQVMLNGIIYYAALMVVKIPALHNVPVFIPLAMASMYVAFAYSALRRSPKDATLIRAYTGMAAAFVALALFAQFKYGYLAAALSAESVALLWLGLRSKVRDFRIYALFAGLLALQMVFVPYTGAAGYQLLINEATITGLFTALCAFTAALLYRRHRDNVSQDEYVMFTVLMIAANLLLVWQFSREVNAYFDHAAALPAAAQWADRQQALSAWFGPRHLTLSAVWILYAMASLAAGMAKKYKPMRLFGLALFGLAVFKIFLIDLSSLDKIYRILSFMVLGGVLLAASFLYQKHKDRIRDWALKD